MTYGTVKASFGSFGSIFFRLHCKNECIFLRLKHFWGIHVCLSEFAQSKKPLCIPLLCRFQMDLMDEAQRGGERLGGIHFHIVKWALALSVYFLESAGMEDGVASHIGVIKLMHFCQGKLWWFLSSLSSEVNTSQFGVWDSCTPSLSVRCGAFGLQQTWNSDSVQTRVESRRGERTWMDCGALFLLELKPVCFIWAKKGLQKQSDVRRHCKTTHMDQVQAAGGAGFISQVASCSLTLTTIPRGMDLHITLK